MKLEEAEKRIGASDKEILDASKKKWNSIAKPLYSLGKLESMVSKICAIRGDIHADIKKRALVIFCADNGIVARGVTQSDSSVTATVSANFCEGKTSVCRMAACADVDLFPVDIGINRVMEVEGLLDRKVMFGTKDFTEGPAMSREEAVKAIEVGIDLAFSLKEKGYDILATGEMGIGNTTTSSAVASVLLEKEPEVVTGVGAGLTNEGLKRKIQVIRDGISRNAPFQDPIDLIAKLGGLDIAGMVGLYLGGAAAGIPVLIDGFISAVSALLAVRYRKEVWDYLIPSHVSAEPAGMMVLDALGLSPLISCGMCLGEGTGAVAAIPLLDMAFAVYHDMSTFENAGIEQYEDYQNKPSAGK